MVFKASGSGLFVLNRYQRRRQITVSEERFFKAHHPFLFSNAVCSPWTGEGLDNGIRASIVANSRYLSLSCCCCSSFFSNFQIEPEIHSIQSNNFIVKKEDRKEIETLLDRNKCTWTWVGGASKARPWSHYSISKILIIYNL